MNNEYHQLNKAPTMATEDPEEEQQDDSIDILGDKENLPPWFHYNTVTEKDEEMKAGEQTTANEETEMDHRADISPKDDSGDITHCESDAEVIDELGHISHEEFNDHLSKSRNRTSTPVNEDNIHDFIQDSLNEPNIHTEANVTATSCESDKTKGETATRSGRSSSSSSDSSSSSSGTSSSEDADDSVQDPDFDNHIDTDSASTETMNSSFELPSPQPTNSNDNGNVKKGRKRTAVPTQWLQNKRKRLRNTGQAYKTHKNKDIPARCVKPPCGQTCRFKCSAKITEDERRHIFEEYWKLGDINRQRNYIHHKLVPITRKYRYTIYTIYTTQKGRDYNRAFYLYIMGQKIRVCKHFFMRTLDINERVIRTVISKHTATGEIENDQRGKHENQIRVPEEIKNSVRSHINSIPRIESHYLRQQTTREFIDGGKTIAELHRDYQEERIKYNLPFANYVLYAKIFNTEFNLGFYVPKKDLCELCDSYENARNDEKRNIEEKYNRHIQEKNQSRLEKNADKEKVSSNYIVAVYDLQAVLPCPKGEISVFYYKSKLNTLNLTITELKTKHTECYLWHEGEGHRGSNEIGSCVYKYIEKKLTSSSSDFNSASLSDDDSNPNVEMVFYSDSCCGQNKNQFIITLYIFAVMKFPKLTSITHINF